MSEIIEKPESSALSAAPTPRDLQRAALRDLVVLATECATTEAQIERRHKAALEVAGREFDRAQWAVEPRYKQVEEQFRQRHQERLAKIEGQHRQELTSVQTAERSARAKADHEFGRIEGDVKKKFEHARWLAESVLEVSQNQANAQHKATREAIATQVEELAQMRAAAIEQMRRYRFNPTGGEIEQTPPPSEKADETFTEQKGLIKQHLKQMENLGLAKLFVGAWPAILLVLLCAGAGAAGYVLGQKSGNAIMYAGIAAGGVFVLALGLGVALRVVSIKQIARVEAAMMSAQVGARLAAQAQLQNADVKKSEALAAAAEKAKSEVGAAREQLTPIRVKAAGIRDAAIAQAVGERTKRATALEAARAKAMEELKAWLDRHMEDMKQKQEAELKAAREKNVQQLKECEQQYEESRSALERRLSDGLGTIGTPGAHGRSNGEAPIDWTDPAWKGWKPPKKFPRDVRFGELKVDLKQFADSVPQQGPLQLQLPPAFAVPAALAFPRQASLLIQTDRDGREMAIKTLQMVMARLLTSLPAGRVRFTILDPVGLGQNFAGFMHLADYDEALVGGRIWTSTEQIEQRLADLTDHMETVIQKYLRNEFETIDDYNDQAGELAEPYRFLVIADFPVGFSDESVKRLASIVASGARCGVYTLIARDIRQSLPGSSTIVDDLEANSVNLIQEVDKLVWKDEVFQQFPMGLDQPPAEEFLTQTLQVVGQEARNAKRVEVPFDTISPREGGFWAGSTSDVLEVPIGRMGATRLQTMRLGKGVAQHVLVAGKTGSGKSTLLHILITNLSLWYSPEQVEFYMIDFKKGVEFKTYAVHALPHARAIAVESDREFGLSVLQRLDAELSRRGEIFRRLGVQDLPSYRAQGDVPPMPRTLLIIDEYQEFFSEDDKLAQDASLLLDRLVRQGRAFGVHVLLGSQTIGGTSGLSRSTIGQIAVRIALQTSEADSQIILGDGNSAARLLSRPGEAIYNDQGGLVEANSPFQISWLNDDERERHLIKIQTTHLDPRAKAVAIPAIVFEGNAPSDITVNAQLAAALAGPGTTRTPLAWLGEPVAIKDPSAVTFKRQSGANVLMVGQQEEAAMAITASSIISLAAQQKPDLARFIVLDGSAADSPLAAVLPHLKTIIPHQFDLLEYRLAGEGINELAQELEKRRSGDSPDTQSIYIIIYGLQRYRMLRKQEESFGFSASSDEEKGPAADKQFADILREGPNHGIHVIAWCDTLVSVDRTLDRGSMREFDNRILFQMSANDSSNLIDNPGANKLGFYRALSYSEEHGVMEKFRPYALPPKEWLAQVAAKFSGRA